MILFHYTCAHAAPKIERAGELRGWPHKMLPQVGPIVWLTHMKLSELPAPVERLALGMPPNQPGCERFAFRVTVDVEEPTRWPQWARCNVHLVQRQALETNCRGTMIAYWWLSLTPVPVVNIEPLV